MSYLALYRKYRPNNFNEVVGQNYVIKILKNSLANNKISHAYLFSGPRGTGKTSIAKLIAKAVNCKNMKDFLPCETCDSCISYKEKNNPDIIEIDAASNNGVDEIREIRDKVSLMPSISKYKIYIIDEVHMLSSGAFNALLKTLEEPPKHVIFILATTEFYKVPETIVSRCQCFDFEKISDQDIVNKLTEIVAKEGILIEEAVLPLIAKHSNGGLRDAISMLDKLSCCLDKITIDDFFELRGIANDEEVKEIFSNLMEKDITELFKNVDNLAHKGKNLILFAEELIDYFKNMLIAKLENEQNINIELFRSQEKVFKIIDILNETIINMKKSSYSKTLFEVGLLKILNVLKEEKDIEIKEKNIKFESKESNIIFEEKQVPEQVEREVSSKIVEKIEMEDSYSEEKILEKEEKVTNLANLIEENRKIRINNTFATANKSILEDLKIRWIDISEYLHNKEFSSVVSFLLDGNVRVAGENNIIISVAYSSILENALVNLEKIETLLNLVTKKYYKIAFILDSEWEILRKKYINDIHSGVKYEYKEEIEFNSSLLQNHQSKDEQSEVVKEAASLFGDDMIEIK